MTEQRVYTLIAAYGADPVRWPEDEREAAMALLDATPALRAILNEALTIDGFLDTNHHRQVLTPEAILAQLPAPGLIERIQRWGQRVLDWLTPSAPSDFWRPAVAAMVPLALGVAIGVGTAADSADWSTTEAYVFAPYVLEATDE